jgi:hypothetical protein
MSSPTFHARTYEEIERMARSADPMECDVCGKPTWGGSIRYEVSATAGKEIEEKLYGLCPDHTYRQPDPHAEILRYVLKERDE